MHRLWVRYELDGRVGFGTLEGDRVAEYHGDLFGAKAASGRSFALREARRLAPTQPTKVIALWNNFGALGEKLGLAVPEEPLYLLKSPNSYLERARRADPQPRDDGKVVFEGELGIVIGKTCSAVPEEQALDHVFGYTCANDVTVADILQRDTSFAQWVARQGLRHLLPAGAGGRHRARPGSCASGRCWMARCARTIRSATCAFRWSSWSA